MDHDKQTLLHCVLCKIPLNAWSLFQAHNLSSLSFVSFSMQDVNGSLYTDAEVYFNLQPSNTSQYLCFKAPPHSPAPLIILMQPVLVTDTFPQCPATSVKHLLHSVYRAVSQNEHQSTNPSINTITCSVSKKRQ